jgi:formylglycine-generating enzyme required for sulfatase activity
MNKNQKIVVLVAGVIFLIMFLFPPVVVQLSRNIQYKNVHHQFSFILSMPNNSSINIIQLFVQFLGIGVVALLSWLLLKDDTQTKAASKLTDSDDDGVDDDSIAFFRKDPFIKTRKILIYSALVFISLFLLTIVKTIAFATTPRLIASIIVGITGAGLIYIFGLAKSRMSKWGNEGKSDRDLKSGADRSNAALILVLLFITLSVVSVYIINQSQETSTQTTTGLPQNVIKNADGTLHPADGYMWRYPDSEDNFEVIPVSSARSSQAAHKTLTNDLGMTFVYIKPGSFTMGSPVDEPGREHSETPHRVTLTRGFYMQTTEVTQGQWKAIMGYNPSNFYGCGNNCPVENITWYEVQAFIRKLNQRTGKTYRLPTEAEWEYACRAGSTTAFSNGAITELKCNYDPHLNAMAWYCYNSKITYSGFITRMWSSNSYNNGTHPVAQKLANEWGLYDMHGNVSEWCQDCCVVRGLGSNSPYIATTTYKDGIVDPLCLTGDWHVCRGGYFNLNPTGNRSASVLALPQEMKYGFCGFRLAASADQ